MWYQIKEFPDHLLMRGARAIQRTIPECIPVKVKNEKKKIVFMPQSHEGDLKDPAFKIKGLGKKNMHNKYEKDKKRWSKKIGRKKRKSRKNCSRKCSPKPSKESLKFSCYTSTTSHSSSHTHSPNIFFAS